MGVILGAHGIKGELKVKSFAALATDIAAYGSLSDEAGKRHFALTLARGKTGTASANGIVIARLDGIVDRDAAQALKGQRLYVDRDLLPKIAEKDTFYAADLIGLRALDPNGRNLGRVVNLADYGAGNVLEIEGGSMGPFAAPFVTAFVPSVDLGKGEIVIDLPQDFFAGPEGRNEDKS
jgi:16S rRNA processing protein RimM